MQFLIKENVCNSGSNCGIGGLWAWLFHDTYRLYAWYILCMHFIWFFASNFPCLNILLYNFSTKEKKINLLGSMYQFGREVCIKPWMALISPLSLIPFSVPFNIFWLLYDASVILSCTYFVIPQWMQASIYLLEGKGY